MFIELKFISVA